MKCENIRLLLTAYLIGEPDAALKKTVEEHLETCCDCRASLQKIRSTLDLVQGALAATQKAPARLSPEQRKRVLSTRPAAPVSWLTVNRPMVARVAAVLVAGFVVISVVTHMLSYRVRSVIGGAACDLGSELSKGDDALLPMMPPSDSAPAAAPANAGDIGALGSLGYLGPQSGKPAGETLKGRSTGNGKERVQDLENFKALAKSENSLNTEMKLGDTATPVPDKPTDTFETPAGGGVGGGENFGIGRGATDDDVGFEVKFPKAPPAMKRVEKNWYSGGKDDGFKYSSEKDEDGGFDKSAEQPSRSETTYGDGKKGPAPQSQEKRQKEVESINVNTLTPDRTAPDDTKGGKFSHNVGAFAGSVTAKLDDGRFGRLDGAEGEGSAGFAAADKPSAPAKGPTPEPAPPRLTSQAAALRVKSAPSAFFMRKGAAPVTVDLPGLGGTSGKTDPAVTADVNGPAVDTKHDMYFSIAGGTIANGQAAAKESSANNAKNNEIVLRQVELDYDATPSDTPPIREWNNSFRREDVAKAKAQLKDRTDNLAREPGRADEPVVEEPPMEEPAPILGNIPITGRLFSHGGMNARQPEKQIDAVSTAEASKLNVTVTADSRSSPLQVADETTLEGGATRGRATEGYEEKEREKTTPASVTPASLVLAQLDLKKTLGEANRRGAGEIASGGDKASPVVDYRIKSGETLSGIAKLHGVSMKDLAELNGLQNADSIKAGATILVPVTTPGGEQATQLQTAEKEPKGPVFKAVGLNPFVNVNENAFSTFSMDVDTASYTLARNYMLKGFLPPAESVRTEDFINFFDYAYKPPTDKLFAIYTDCAPTPFQRGLHLLKIGVEGKRLAHDEKRHAVLTFVIDTSGSMSEPDRLGLIQKSLRLLIDQLDPADSVAIVQYDSHARLVLDRTMVTDKKAILAALDGLQTSGSTNLEEGMREAYKLASRRFVPGAANRILLLSDGAANIGSTSASDILAQVESSRKQGIYCSVFGFGIGTYNDDMLKNLASKGDGTYAFIDSMDEAKRVFVEQLAGTLNVIAADAKIQIEFNPERVKRYRQIGYEERQLKKEQFRDDTVDAGEVGSGQSVTALYELELYAQKEGPIGTVHVRYRNTGTGKIEEFARPISQSDISRTFEATDVRFKLAAAVAEFSEILRGSDFAKGSSYKDVAAVLRPVALELNLDFRLQELLRMVQGAPSMPRVEVK